MYLSHDDRTGRKIGWNFVKSEKILDSIGKILPRLANSYEQRNLSLFYQLMPRCIAPTLLKNDHWIHYISGGPFIWIHVHHCRLLPTEELLRLLRSILLSLCISEWFMQWDSPRQVWSFPVIDVLPSGGCINWATARGWRSTTASRWII